MPVRRPGIRLRGRSLPELALGVASCFLVVVVVGIAWDAAFGPAKVFRPAGAPEMAVPPTFLGTPDPPASDRVVADSFDGPPGAPTTADGSITWQAPAGGWTRGAGSLRLTEPAGSPPSLLITEAEPGRFGIRIHAELGRLTNSEGLVFRYRGPKDYWRVKVTPQFELWTVEQVVNGQPAAKGVPATYPVRSRTSVDVVDSGSTVDVWVNDLRLLSVPGLQPDWGGVGVGADEAGTEFFGFEISRPREPVAAN